MEKVKIDIKPTMLVVICLECNDGVYGNRADEKVYYSDPVQADFTCSNCGHVKRLSEPDFPQITFDFKGIK